MIKDQESWPDKGIETHTPLVCVSSTALLFLRATLATLVAALTFQSAISQTYTLDNDGPTNLTLLQGDTLNEAFYGRTMDGTYKGVRELSGTSDFTETFHKNGRTTYREGKVTDIGRWKLSGAPGFEDVICFTYSGPLAGSVSCFTVFREGTCLYSYIPREIENGKPRNTNRWSAKTVIRGELSSCDDLVG